MAIPMWVIQHFFNQILIYYNFELNFKRVFYMYNSGFSIRLVTNRLKSNLK